MVTLASSTVIATINAPGWATPTSGQVMSWPIITPGTSGWTLGAWADFTDQSYTSYAIAAAIGLTETTRTNASLDHGSVGMDGGPLGRVESRPSNTVAARVPSYVINQGPVHLATRYEHVVGDEYTVTLFINGVPMYHEADTITGLDAAFLQFGETTASGAIKAPDRFANTFYEPRPLTDAEISAKYLSEYASLGVTQKKLLAVGSFDSLTAFEAAPFWATSADATLRHGAHFLLDAIGGSRHGGGADLTGAAENNYNSAARQGLRREGLIAAAAHYDEVYWLCQYGTNDLVSGEMDPTLGDGWEIGSQTIDGMIFRDIAQAADPSKIKAVLITIPAHGGFYNDWVADGSPTTVEAATTNGSKREVSRTLYNQDCRDNFAARGYDYLIDLASHIPAGFASLEAAAIDAIATAGNTVFQSDGIHWTDAGGAAAAADKITPFLSARLTALQA